MNEIKISERGARALAAVVHELRGDWDEPGIVAALGKATDARWCRDGTHLVVAAVRAASDRNNRTPAVIPLDGEHWRAALPGRPSTTGPDARHCRDCSTLIYPGEELHTCRRSQERARSEAAQREIDIARRVIDGKASEWEIKFDAIRRRANGEHVEAEATEETEVAVHGST